MNEQRRQILEMLAEGKVTTDEAERLIDALERRRPEAEPAVASRAKARPKYLRLMVLSGETSEGDGPSRVDVQVPLQLLRAGVRLAGLVPAQALTRVNAELARSGVPIDLTELKPQQLEELIDHLDDVTVNVEEPDAKVMVFCE